MQDQIKWLWSMTLRRPAHPSREVEIWSYTPVIATTALGHPWGGVKTATAKWEGFGGLSITHTDRR